jgi:hypothetical protein
MDHCRSCVIITTLLVASASMVLHAQAAPLRLLLACSQASELTFRFTIQNVSSDAHCSGHRHYPRE